MQKHLITLSFFISCVAIQATDNLFDKMSNAIDRMEKEKEKDE